MPRLHDVTEGRILIDGNDIRDLSLSALRGTVAVAFEDPTLFSMSVSENLTLGRPVDDPAGDEEIAAAIEVAAAMFVYDLPFGLATRIGEQDEPVRWSAPTAGPGPCDPGQTAHPGPRRHPLSPRHPHRGGAVTAALRKVLTGVTGIVVAHRASTVLLADKVALLDRIDGAATITHIGTHQELLAGVPRYRYLLAADDELDDGCEPQPVWEVADARRELDQGYQEARALRRRPDGYLSSEAGSR